MSYAKGGESSILKQPEWLWKNKELVIHLQMTTVGFELKNVAIIKRRWVWKTGFPHWKGRNQ